MMKITISILCTALSVAISFAQGDVLPSGADLSISVVQSPEPVVAGQLITYTIIATNQGPDAASNIAIGFGLNDAVKLLSVGISQGQHFLEDNQVGGYPGTIPSGGNVMLTVTGIGLEQGLVPYWISVESQVDDDPNYDNNYLDGTTTLLAGPGLLTFERASYAVSESISMAHFVVRRTGGTIGAVSVSYASSNLSAVAGSDFTGVAGVLNFAEGVSTQSITVNISDDPAHECNERLLLQLHNVTGGGLLVPDETQASVLIFDNDLVPSGQIEGVSIAFGTPPRPTAAGDSTRHAVSADGRYVAFISKANNLVTNDLNTTHDLFVRDLTNGTTVLASVSLAGTAAGSYAWENPRISANGAYVAYSSSASNLVAVDTNKTTDIFLFNTHARTNILISVNHTGSGAGNAVSFDGALNADGRFVVFASRASNLVTNDTNGNEIDVFLRDISTGQTELISLNSAGTGSANYSSHTPAVSPDGRYVAFISAATDLNPLDTDSNYDLYVRDRALQTNQLISINSEGTAAANSYTSFHWLSGNGRVIVFQSDASDLAVGDANMADDIFAYNLDTHQLQMVSVNRFGTNSGNRGSFGASVSADGRYVAFESYADDLVGKDNNDGSDVFLRDLVTGTTKLVSTICSEQQVGNAESSQASLSADGRFVAFASNATDLTGGDFTSPYFFRYNIFCRDMVAGETVLVSMNSSASGGAVQASGSPQMSADGGVISFYSDSSDLLELDSNDSTDILVWYSTAPVPLVQPELSVFLSNGMLKVRWPSATPASFVLEATANLGANSSWMQPSQPLVDDGTWKTFTSPVPPGRMFYRLRNND